MPITVLLVDDHATNRAVAQAYLERLGCAVASAEDGIAAVQAVLQRRFDLVLMDLQMPRMDGLTATRAIRGHEARQSLPRTPIVALTALARPEDRQRCAEAGMEDHLAKPLVEGDLRSVLRRHCPAWRDPVAPLQPAGQPTPPSPVRPEIDPGVVLRLRELDPALASELWLEYAGELPGRCAEVQAAAARGDDQAAQHLVHGLKGSAGTLGLARLHHHLEALDRAIRRREPGWQERCAVLGREAEPAAAAARQAAAGG